MHLLKKWHALLSLSVLLLSALPGTTQNFNLEWRSTLTLPGQSILSVGNVGGYVQDGREYALVCTEAGLVIVDVTEPDTPIQITVVAAPNPTREVKVYQHYAYATGTKLQIIDLSNLPDTNLANHYYAGDGEIDGLFAGSHTLHIDTATGFIYLHGTALGGSIVLDLNIDPYNPHYLGKYDDFGYVHDGFAFNDTLYACHPYEGLLAIVDMNDKENPVVLGTTPTPGNFTHSSWLLGDRRTVLTTDEASPSYLVAYDFTDPGDIQELDRIATTEGGFSALAHNIDVINDWAVVSWYKDGVVLVDAHKPDNLVITGWYDTTPEMGNGFGGCYGAFPWFPSGTIAATNMNNPTALILLTPNYVRATYLEGTILSSCTGGPLSDVVVSISGNDPFASTQTDLNGVFKTGLAATDSFTVTFSKIGFTPQSFVLNSAPGEVFEFNITLEAETYNYSATLVESWTNMPVANTAIELNGPQNYTIQTDGNGQFNLNCMPEGTYEVVAGVWGLRPAIISVTSSESTVIELENGYFDGFALDLGWTISGTSTDANWERCFPVGQVIQNVLTSPDMDDSTDINLECYITGNGDGVNVIDVDFGTCSLTSPFMDLSEYEDALLSFTYWFYTGTGPGAANDNITVWAENGSQSVVVFNKKQPQSDWLYSGDIHLADFLALTDSMQIKINVSDLSNDNVVEGGLDHFQVVPVISSSTHHIDQQALVQVTPNPSSTGFAIQYDWAKADGATLEVRNLLGQTLLTRTLNGDKGAVQFGSEWPRGTYFAVLRKSDGQQSVPLRMLKQ